MKKPATQTPLEIIKEILEALMLNLEIFCALKAGIFPAKCRRIINYERV